MLKTRAIPKSAQLAFSMLKQEYLNQCRSLANLVREDLKLDPQEQWEFDFDRSVMMIEVPDTESSDAIH
jgi:hypothetical protein